MGVDKLNKEDWDTGKLRKYLLADLPEREMQAIDLEIFTNRELVEWLAVTEDELMEDFLDKQLTGSELKSFKLYFLNSPKRVERLNMLRVLLSFAKNEYISDTNDVQSQTIPAAIKSFFSKKRYPVLVVSAFCLLLFGGIAAFLLFYPGAGKDSPSQIEISRINQRDKSNLSEYENQSHFSLAPGIVRDKEALKSLSKADLTETVLLRLAVPNTVKSNSFQVNISRQGDSSGNDLRLALLREVQPFSQQNGLEVRLLLPASLLTPGTYRVDIQPSDGGSSGGDGEDRNISYFFLVL